MDQAAYFAQESIVLVNEARTRAGLPRLQENDTLGRVAMAYSQRMARENFYGHVDPQGKGVGERIAATGYVAQMSAENIGRGQRDPATVVDGWLKSPGHRANILNADAREIGAGYAIASPPYFHVWTHVFAAPDGSVGRDRNKYASALVAEINRVRGQDGAAPLTLHPTLESIATSHLQAIANERAFRSEANRTLNEASRAALKSFQHAPALVAAGAATPEEAVAQWTKGEGGRTLRDRTLRVAGAAYLFAAQDRFRHYWLLVLGG